MNLFSARYGYVKNPVQYESMTPELRNRIWNVYSREVYIDCMTQDSNYMEELMDLFGLTFKNVYEEDDVEDNLKSFQKWYMSLDWYRVYDFIEAYLAFLPPKNLNDAIANFNDVLTQNNAGYRIVDRLVIPITSQDELDCLEKAQTTAYDSVNIHISKATELFSRRPSPDYENSIKESISAVEAMCCIIMDDRKATLGDALKRLNSKGIHLHNAFQRAMSSLYGYTSDEGGLRHGSIDFTGASREDAQYMLISCSAFVNYLIAKWQKVQ